MSRLKSRTPYTKAFARPSNLLLERCYIENEKLRNLFIADSKSKITKFYSQKSGPFMLIECQSRNSKDEITTKIYLINSITAKSIGYMDLKMAGESVQYLLNDDIDESIDSLNDLNGHMYFYSSHNLYYSNYNRIACILKGVEGVEGGRFKQLLLLNSTHLLVVLEKRIVLVGVNESRDKASVNNRVSSK